jgi:hypothetical protein
MTRLRRGPILCDAGQGEHAALNPQVVTLGRRSRIMCANCALRAVSDAIRKGQASQSEPLALVQERQRTARRAPVARGELAEVVRLKAGGR